MIENVNFDDTKRLVNECAKHVADDIRESISDYELEKMVVEHCENEVFGNVCNGLQILASYGWSDALTGGVDYEESPLYLFEDDVLELVKELLEDEGIEIN